MLRSLAWVSLVSLASLLAVAAPAAADPPAKVQARPRVALPKRFELKPPKGFRPGDTVERLADALASERGGRYQQHPDVTLHMTEDGPVLSIHTQILGTKDEAERAGLQHVLGFATSYGFSMHVEGATPAEHEALRKALDAYGAGALVPATH